MSDLQSLVNDKLTIAEARIEDAERIRELEARIYALERRSVVSYSTPRIRRLHRWLRKARLVESGRVEALKREIDSWEDCVRKGDSEIETLQERTRGLEALTAVSAVALRDAIRQLRCPVQDMHDRIAIANRAAHVLARYDATQEVTNDI